MKGGEDMSVCWWGEGGILFVAVKEGEAAFQKNVIPVHNGESRGGLGGVGVQKIIISGNSIAPPFISAISPSHCAFRSATGRCSGLQSFSDFSTPDTFFSVSPIPTKPPTANSFIATVGGHLRLADVKNPHGTRII